MLGGELRCTQRGEAEGALQRVHLELRPKVWGGGRVSRLRRRAYGGGGGGGDGAGEPRCLQGEAGKCVFSSCHF